MKLTRVPSWTAAVVLAGVLAPAALAVNSGRVEYYHHDALGNVRVVTDETGQVLERHDYLPFGEECTTGACAANPVTEPGQPRKFTGKERDRESGLDYFGARYYVSRVGRFTTIDPVYTWSENLADPQRWNRYAYGRNNPLRYVDPDGRAIETPWDALNVGIGAASLASNVAAANWGNAALDAAGLVYDVAATVVPGLPGGAGTTIKTARAADRLADAVKAGDKASDAANAIRGGETAATKAGREAHQKFAERVRGKAADGWQSEPKVTGPHGETLRPDAISPSGRPVELKPNTPSGHRRGEAQLRKYEAATGKQGRVVYYNK
jgi:RHS repeat-associated protein